MVTRVMSYYGGVEIGTQSTCLLTLIGRVGCEPVKKHKLHCECEPRVFREAKETCLKHIFSYFLKLYVYECFACLRVRRVHVHRSQKRMSVRSPGTEIEDDFELPCGWVQGIESWSSARATSNPKH